MTKEMNLRLGLMLVFVLAACWNEAPDKSSPWVAVLAEAPSLAVASQRAQELVERFPDLLRGSTALSIQKEGEVVHHLVVSPAFKSQREAENLAQVLAKSHPARLKVIDITSLRRAGGKGLKQAPPTAAETLMKLASFLPTPRDDELGSFLILIDPEKSGRPFPEPFGRAFPLDWSLGLGKLAWKATAEAVYRIKSSDNGEVLVFVGYLGPQAVGGQEAVRQVHSFLLNYVNPTEEEWERAIQEKKKARKSKKKKLPRRGRKRARLQKSAPEPLAVPAASSQSLAVTKTSMMPWGPTEVHVLERVTFESRERIRKSTPVKTAWIGCAPGCEAVFLMLFDREETMKPLLIPVELGEPHGIAFSSPVMGAFQLLPEVPIKGEQLVYLGMENLAQRLDRKRRGLPWVKHHRMRPVMVAGYLSAETRWQVSWVDLATDKEAELVFNQAYVDPRREMLQAVLKSRRRIRYEVGISLREVVDVQGWYLSGALDGRLQELYFRKGTRLWLLRTPQSGMGAMDPDGLLARVELLQIWDEPI